MILLFFCCPIYFKKLLNYYINYNIKFQISRFIPSLLSRICALSSNPHPPTFNLPCIKHSIIYCLSSSFVSPCDYHTTNTFDNSGILKCMNSCLRISYFIKSLENVLMFVSCFSVSFTHFEMSPLRLFDCDFSPMLLISALGHWTMKVLKCFTATGKRNTDFHGLI